MDALPRALAAALTASVCTDCELVWIRQVAGPRLPGVHIGYLRDGTEHAIEDDFALLALPLNRLSAIELDLPDAVRAALQGVEVADAIKITFETPVRPLRHRPGRDPAPAVAKLRHAAFSRDSASSPSTATPRP